MIDFERYSMDSHTELNRSTAATSIDLLYNAGEGASVVGTVFREERTWHDFLETDYADSFGVIKKRYERADGHRIAEHFDTAEGKYEYSEFDHSGTLLRRENRNQYGDYTVTERQEDGTYTTENGTSVFVNKMPDIEKN